MLNKKISSMKYVKKKSVNHVFQIIVSLKSEILREQITIKM